MINAVRIILDERTQSHQKSHDILTKQEVKCIQFLGAHKETIGKQYLKEKQKENHSRNKSKSN